IDDFVDDDFLAKPVATRVIERPSALATVTAWREASTAALASGTAPAASDPFKSTNLALAETHRLAVMDTGPWDRLAGAMQRDVAEPTMADWADFLEYAEGATAAPAAVFIEILALQAGPDGRLVSRLDGPAADRIRNSAVLLYLVHIMRDLAEDAAKGAMMLTLPESLFAEMGMDGATFAASAPTDPTLVQSAQRRIADYAERFLLPALAELTMLDAALDPADAAILRGLCEPYIERYEKFQDS
ncbi:MAG: squalene/phytoene synthase family protein, partial [Alphaproteobacteria bacterium]